MFKLHDTWVKILDAGAAQLVGVVEAVDPPVAPFRLIVTAVSIVAHPLSFVVAFQSQFSAQVVAT